MSTRWPLAGPLAREERGHHALRREHAGHDVRDGHAQPIGRAVAVAGDAHQAAFSLNHRVVAGFVASRAGLSVAGDRGVHQAWMPRVHRLPAEARAIHRAGLEVFDQHIGLGQQPVEHGPPLRVLEIDRHALLVAIDAEEVGALGADERRAPVARVVALAGVLHLDHARAHVGQHHRAVRAGEHAGEIEHRDARERSCHRWFQSLRRRLMRDTSVSTAYAVCVNEPSRWTMPTSPSRSVSR